MKKIALLPLLLLLLSVFLTSCAQNEPVECEIFAMDTLMTVKIWGDERCLTQAVNEINRLDRTLSAVNENSEIFALNETGTAQLGEDTYALLSRAVELSKSTGGAFDPTVYPLVKLWGFPDGNYRVPDADALQSAVIGTEHVRFGGDTVTLDEGCMIDLGGIGKGYAAQCCIDLLAEQGVETAIVSLGGNVQTLGIKPNRSSWVVGIADPQEPSRAIATLVFQDSLAIVTSGSYQRYFELDGTTYHHIIDPETRYPADSGLASVTVLCDNGTTADAYSTALFVMGMEDGIEFWRREQDFEAVFITTDNRIFATEGAEDYLSECEFEVISR